MKYKLTDTLLNKTYNFTNKKEQIKNELNQLTKKELIDTILELDKNNSLYRDFNLHYLNN